MQHRLVIAIVLLVCGCAGSEFRTVDSEQEAAVVEAGAPIAEALLANLVSHLSSAMADGGPAAAVEFCSLNATELTEAVAASEGVDVKRTSLRYRNPANAPDQHETEALRHFADVRAETGSLPQAWVQRVGLDEYRYYRPLVVAAPCLSCHGSADEIDPGVAEVLAERYPDDLATGYSAGDFRGVVRVSIPEDRLRSSAD